MSNKPYQVKLARVRALAVSLTAAFRHFRVLVARGVSTSRLLRPKAPLTNHCIRQAWISHVSKSRVVEALTAKMPAMLEDPTAPVIYRTSGAPPYPTPSNPQIPVTIVPRQVTLRDRITIATLIPFTSAADVPPTLLAYLCSQMNLEIEKGDTYPMIAPMPINSFGKYWFQNFGAVMLLGGLGSIEDVRRLERARADWEKVCLGSFYIKPNYPGRSSHVCNGGFLVTDAARNRGVGRLMGEGYLEWAPQLVCVVVFLFGPDIFCNFEATESCGLTIFYYSLICQAFNTVPRVAKCASGIHLLRLQSRIRD